MKFLPCVGLALVLALTATDRAFGGPITIDDFEDGTLENWFAGGGPVGATPPVPPTNVATGGPAGAGDNFLSITSLGIPGPGGRLVVMNGSQWAGDYLSSGITTIEMDVNNFGTSDLMLRLLFEDPKAGPPLNVATSAAGLLVPASSGWMHLVFSVRETDLVALAGSVSEALMNTTILRLFHSPTASFPGAPVVAELGIDNITADAPLLPAVPEPASLLMFSAAVTAFVARNRLRRRSRRAP